MKSLRPQIPLMTAEWRADIRERAERRDPVHSLDVLRLLDAYEAALGDAEHLRREVQRLTKPR